MSDATATASHTDDWESLVSDVISTTTMTPTKKNTPIRSSSDSPWEDASYTLVSTSTSNRHDRHAASPYFGRFRRGARSSSSSDGSAMSPIIMNHHTLNNHSTTNNNNHHWIREYNVSHAVQYAERFAQQIRYQILYITSWLDFIVAWTISIYILWIVSYHHYHVPSPPPQQQQGVDHSNGIITTIGLCALVIHNVVFHARCLALLTILKPPPRVAPTSTTTTTDDEDDTHYTWTCRMWLSRISTVLLIVWYELCGITILLTWNIGHNDAIRQFVSDQNSESPYNLHGYWRFSRRMIAQIQHNHVMNYLYLAILSFGIMEIVRYHILHSYYTTIVRQQDDEHSSTLLQESLLPLRWDDENINDPSRITTTSWRTTTITNHWWNHQRRRQEAIPDDPSRRSILDPVQFQTIQEEWNYRQEVDGPYWWSRE